MSDNKCIAIRLMEVLQSQLKDGIRGKTLKNILVMLTEPNPNYMSTSNISKLLNSLTHTRLLDRSKTYYKFMVGLINEIASDGDETEKIPDEIIEDGISSLLIDLFIYLWINDGKKIFSFERGTGNFIYDDISYEKLSSLDNLEFDTFFFEFCTDKNADIIKKLEEEGENCFIISGGFTHIVRDENNKMKYIDTVIITDNTSDDVSFEYISTNYNQIPDMKTDEVDGLKLVSLASCQYIANNEPDVSISNKVFYYTNKDESEL